MNAHRDWRGRVLGRVLERRCSIARIHHHAGYSRTIQVSVLALASLNSPLFSLFFRVSFCTRFLQPCVSEVDD